MPVLRSQSTKAFIRSRVRSAMLDAKLEIVSLFEMRSSMKG